MATLCNCTYHRSSKLSKQKKVSVADQGEPPPPPPTPYLNTKKKKKMQGGAKGCPPPPPLILDRERNHRMKETPVGQAKQPHLPPP